MWQSYKLWRKREWSSTESSFFTAGWQFLVLCTVPDPYFWMVTNRILLSLFVPHVLGEAWFKHFPLDCLILWTLCQLFLDDIFSQLYGRSGGISRQLRFCQQEREECEVQMKLSLSAPMGVEDMPKEEIVKSQVQTNRAISETGMNRRGLCNSTVYVEKGLPREGNEKRTAAPHPRKTLYPYQTFRGT